MFKKYKYVYALLIMLLFLMVITAASASDINQTNDVDLSTSNDVIVDTVSANENDAYTNLEDSTRVLDENLKSSDEIYVNSSITENGDGSKDNPFKDMKSAINKSENGSTIYIAPGTYSGLNNTNLTITNSLNIMNWTNGDVIFDGEQKNWIFRIFNNINIQGITFINSNDSAIYISKGNSAISNSIFANNSAKYSQSWGGAIFIDNSNFTIFNCSFVNNSAKYEEAEGGAIYSYKSNLTIFNCSFVNNYAKEYGGAIYSYESNLTIFNCSFMNNSAEYGGGAIFNIYGNFTVSNCSFVNNSAGVDGGAICIGSSDNSTIFNCSFMNNSVKMYGGAIYGKSTVFNCSFVNNSAANFLGWGGAIYGGSTVFYCSFVNNSAGYGGAINSKYSQFFASVFNCSFVNNSAEYDGGAIYGASTVSNCSFVNNSAGYGGAISGGKYISNCNFVNNTAIGIGGAIGVGSDYSSISNCTFVNNNLISINIQNIYNESTFNIILSNNSLNGGLIYNNGTISSHTTIVVLENKTLNSSNNEIILNATIYDDKGNIIICDDFNFTINNKTIKGTLENDTFKANVTLEEGMNFIGAASINGILRDNTVKTAVINFKEPDIIINADNVTKYYGGPERFRVQITDKNGNPLNNTNVTITINGIAYNRTTNESGNTSIPLGLPNGVYDVITECDEYNVSSTVTINPTVIANNFTKIFKNETQYLATFTDSQGNLLNNTDAIFNINGVFYIRKINDSGVAKLNINLPPGEYILTATNPATNENYSSTITVLPNIVENNNITKYYKNDTQYYVRLLDDQGNPVGAGVAVEFNINGVFYTRYTNASGYAKLNINLPAGPYIISATYKGLTVSNSITVLPILEASDLYMRYHDGSKFEVKLLDNQGNPFAKQNITFNINGVLYTRLTDDEGFARLNINLPEGKYIITSSYNGATLSNKITIYDANRPGKQ